MLFREYVITKVAIYYQIKTNIQVKHNKVWTTWKILVLITNPLEHHSTTATIGYCIKYKWVILIYLVPANWDQILKLGKSHQNNMTNCVNFMPITKYV